MPRGRKKLNMTVEEELLRLEEEIEKTKEETKKLRERKKFLEEKKNAVDKETLYRTVVEEMGLTVAEAIETLKAAKENTMN